MQYRRLGKSNLQVSALCLGTMMFGDQTGREEAQAIVADAQAHGVNYIDTADVYTKGASERMVGELLKGQRHDWVVATKLGQQDVRPARTRATISRILDAARGGGEPRAPAARTTWTSSTCTATGNGMDLEEPLRALDAMLRAGKIRYWGVSNFRGWRIAEIVRVAGQLGMPGPVVCQPYYNLLNRMPEVEILPACEHYGIGVDVVQPDRARRAHGQVLAGPAAGRGHARGPGRQAHRGNRVSRGVAAIAQQLEAHAKAKGVALAQFATAWVLAHRAVSSVIAGPRTLPQWQDYCPRSSTPSPPRTRRWSIPSCRPAILPRRATPIRRIRCRRDAADAQLAGSRRTHPCSGDSGDCQYALEPHESRRICGDIRSRKLGRLRRPLAAFFVAPSRAERHHHAQPNKVRTNTG